MATYTEAATTPRRDTPQRRGVKTEEVGPARFVSEPAALGLAAFALTTMVLSIINAGIISSKNLPLVAALALAYGGLVQLLAGMWAFIKNDTFAAVALSSYGGFWISFYLLENTFLKQIPVANQKAALALYLFAWAVFTFYMWIASIRVSGAVQAVFLTLVPAYFFLGLGKAVGSDTLFHIGGAFGIATAACAWYTSAAIVFQRTFRRNVLPMFETRSVQQDVGP